jgi:hypothetical protein
VDIILPTPKSKWVFHFYPYPPQLNAGVDLNMGIEYPAAGICTTAAFCCWNGTYLQYIITLDTAKPFVTFETTYSHFHTHAFERVVDWFGLTSYIRKSQRNCEQLYTPGGRAAIATMCLGC